MPHLILRLVSAVIVALSCVSWCIAGEKEIYRDENVVAIESTWPLYPIVGLHTGAKVCLKVDGKSYCGIRGLRPYYLSIPELHAILFVTEGSKYKVTFHLLDLKTRVVREIDGKGSSFGINIGSDRKLGEKFTDYLDGVTGSKITLVNREADWKDVTIVDAGLGVVEKVDEFIYDDAGNEKSHTIHVSNAHGSPR